MLDRVPRDLPPSLASPRSETALARLGVTQEQLNLAPNITAILKETRGGKKIALEAMRFTDPNDCKFIAEFLDAYDAVPERDRESLPIEAIAISANIDVRHLWGEIMLAVREHSVSQVKLIAVAAHPDITKSRVKFAKEEGGYRDRDALDTMLGALPTAKTTFIGKFFAAGAGETTPENPPPEPAQTFEEDVDVVFPDVSKMQERVQPMRQRMLEAGK